MESSIQQQKISFNQIDYLPTSKISIHPSYSSQNRNRSIWIVYILAACGLTFLLLNLNQSLRRDKAQSLQLLHQVEKQRERSKRQQQKQQDKVDIKFYIPKNIWIYKTQQKDNFFITQCMNNIRYFSDVSGFNITIIKQTTYKNYLSSQINNKIDQKIQNIKQIIKFQQNFINIFSQIKKNIILIQILHHNGGLIITQDTIFTQDLSWIQDINTNIYINKGSNTTAKYFAFYQINHGSPVEPVNKIGAKYAHQKYMIKFPGVILDFFAGISKGLFLQRVLQEYYKIIQNGNYLKEYKQNFDLQTGILQQKDRYKYGLNFALHLVLQIKQYEIEKQFEYSSIVSQFSVDYYGLVTMNSKYFPMKLINFLENIFEDKIYRNIANYTLEQLQQTVGPLRYLVRLPFLDSMNSRLQSLVGNKTLQLIHPKSFLGKYFFINQTDYDYIYLKKIQQPMIDKSAPTWDTLPKIIWLYWNSGLKNASIGNKICIQNLMRNAKLSNFEVREINNSIIQTYIGKQLNMRFENILKNHVIPVFPQTKSNLIRKAIIAKYGGIYLDVSYIALQSLDWIVNIAKYPSQYIFNRFGKLPKVLMFFHPHYGQPFQWQYDQISNTKRMKLTAYQNNLIIAEPHQELFNQWINQYELVLTSPYPETRKRMEQYEVHMHSWTQNNDLYLTSMDSLKNVIGRKQKQLEKKQRQSGYNGPKSAAQYYGIWSMSGYRGQQKIRIHTNFDNSYYKNPQSSDNVFLYRYSQEYTDGILGKANQFIKLYNWNIRHLTELLEQQYDNNFTQQINGESYLMKYLIQPLEGRIYKRFDNLYIKDN